HVTTLQSRIRFVILRTVCSPPVLSTPPYGDLSYARLQGSVTCFGHALTGTFTLLIRRLRWRTQIHKN
ncbi:MAG: hypothetical protein LBF22_12850, partial [Deltaproteobacteria bacterium]|nr:hypothetical protein [Deltaproteobacteria bacterium]